MNTLLLLSFFFAGGALLALFFLLERKKPSLPVIIMVATLCAAAAVGRVIFNFIPQVQPVTAIVLIAGLCLGRSAGFLVGALSALASNLALGQGPWTPWQMLAWGIIGILAGCLSRTRVRDCVPLLCVIAFLCGLLYSLLLDCYTVASIGGALTLPMVLTTFGAGLLFNLSHAVGNVIFILLLYRPLGKKLMRIQMKYEWSVLS